MKQTDSHSAPSHSYVVTRRGELMAELFLQSLEPVSIARPPEDLGYDLLVSFANSRGGINTFGVEVKATEQPSGSFAVINRRVYDLLAHSTIPGLLLVADVKRNNLFYAWPPRLDTRRSEPKTIKVPLFPIDDETKKELHRRFTATNH